MCPFDFVNGILRKNYTPLHFPANLSVTAMVPNIIKIVQTPSQMSLSNFLASRGAQQSGEQAYQGAEAPSCEASRAMESRAPQTARGRGRVQCGGGSLGTGDKGSSQAGFCPSAERPWADSFSSLGLRYLKCRLGSGPALKICVGSL